MYVCGVLFICKSEEISVYNSIKGKVEQSREMSSDLPYTSV